MMRTKLREYEEYRKRAYHEARITTHRQDLRIMKERAEEHTVTF